jgi:hypothetical protein
MLKYVDIILESFNPHFRIILVDQIPCLSISSGFIRNHWLPSPKAQLIGQGTWLLSSAASHPSPPVRSGSTAPVAENYGHMELLAMTRF